MKIFYYYNFPLCKLGIAEENGAVCGIYFDKSRTTEGYNFGETPLIKKTASQLDDYFNGKRKVFDLPLALHGTDFQITVWKALQSIPFGETRTYGQIAAITGNPRASRAVGMANNRNPIPIIIPCHRVIGYNGALTGYAGGLKLKQKLIDLEKAT